MLIVGAGGLAKQILDLLVQEGWPGEFVFFDEINVPSGSLYGRFSVLHKEVEARALLVTDPRFVLAVGAPRHRERLCERFERLGGQVVSVISESVQTSPFAVPLPDGVVALSGVVVEGNSRVGRACLLNLGARVHHDVQIGDFSEVGPGAHLLGGVHVGRVSSIGAAAVVLPGVCIGSNVRVGAGSVVTRDVPDALTVAGNPATEVRK